MRRAAQGITSIPKAALTASVAVASLLGATACGGSQAKPGDERRGSSRRVVEDSDEEDGVTLQTSRGVLEPDQIRGVVEPHSNELSSCYLSRVGDRRWLGGRVLLKWELEADGAVRSVHIAESDLGTWPVEKCLLEHSRRLKFPAPRGGATDFTVPLEFSATGSAVVWDEDRSATALGDQLARLDTCGQAPVPAGAPAAAAAAAPLLEGPHDLLVTLYANSQGHVLSAGFSVEDQTGFSERWADCAYNLAMTWRIPDPRAPVVKLAARYAGPANAQ